MPGRRTVLLVDDDQDIVGAVRELVATVGDDIAVRVAHSGAEALEVMRHEHVDLLVSDYRMPGMTGVELLCEARTLAPDTPRVLFTAFPDANVARRAFAEADAAFFIPKMAAPEAIAGVLDAALEGRAAPQGFVSEYFSTTRPVPNPAGLRGGP